MLYGTYPVFLAGAVVGQVKIEQSGLMTAVSCECKAGCGVLRLAAVHRGTSTPVGVMMPENGMLVLHKQLTKSQTQQLGLAFAESFILTDGANAVQEEWMAARAPEELFADVDIAASCKGAVGILQKKSGDLTLVAVPLSASEPFPMMPVFCFGSSEEIDGRQYVVFGIRQGEIVV